MPAVLGDVVDVDEPRVPGGVAHVGDQQPACGVEPQGLVRRLHGRRLQDVRDDRVRRVVDVHHVHAGPFGPLVRDVVRPEQRRVPIGALVACVVDIALDPVATRVAEVRDHPSVAEVALRRSSGVVVGLGGLPLNRLGERPRVAGDVRRRVRGG